MPDNKVAAAGIAGALTVLILYIARLLGLDDIPAEVGGALTTVLSFIAGVHEEAVRAVNGLWHLGPVWADRLYFVAFVLLVCSAVLEAKLAAWRPKTPFFLIEVALTTWAYIWWRQ